MSIKEIFENGYTLLPSLINSDTCDKLKLYLDNTFNENLSYNFFKGHYQNYLPTDFIPEDILFNNKIHEIVAGIFGKNNYYLYSYTCNSNIADEDQPYHMDCTHYHPLSAISLFGNPGLPLQLIVNIYLQDTDESNGSFEISPGSHRFTDFEMGEDGEVEEPLRTIRCNLPKGSVIIRDKRTWHRGTKNLSKVVRHMVGTNYSINWYKSNSNINFDKSTESNFYLAPFSIHNLRFTS